MKTLKTIGLVLLVLLAVIIAISAFAPAKMNVEESILINADAQTVFDELNDFKRWPQWNAWSHRDKEIKWTFSDPSFGQGATMSWESSKVGKGRQIIEVTEPNRHVITKLNFSGWEGDNYESFFIEEASGGTKVTRSLDGAEFKFMMRGFGILMYKMVKNDYQEGLNNLKKICETKSKEIAFKIEIKTIKSIVGFAIMDTSSAREIGQKLGADFSKIGDYMQQIKSKQTGPPFAVYYDFKNDTMVFKAGIPTSKNLPEKGNIKSIKIKGGRAVVAYYQGSFKNIGQVHGAINKMILDKKLLINGSPIEIYVTDPAKEPDPNKWLTEVYYPIK